MTENQTELFHQLGKTKMNEPWLCIKTKNSGNIITNITNIFEISLNDTYFIIKYIANTTANTFRRFEINDLLSVKIVSYKEGLHELFKIKNKEKEKEKENIKGENHE